MGWLTRMNPVMKIDCEHTSRVSHLVNTGIWYPYLVCERILCCFAVMIHWQNL